MVRRTLIIYIPVIHRGYIELLTKVKDKVDQVYVIDEKFVKKLSEYEPSIAALKTLEAAKLLRTAFGISKIKVLNQNTLSQLKDKPLILVKDDISQRLNEKYLNSRNILWKNVFLRWDRSKVISKTNVKCPVSRRKSDTSLMGEAYLESDKSSDWWRQVGAVLVKEGKIILKAYNKGRPDDHSPYQVGGIRDYLNVGERPDLSPTLHAEQAVITEAAKQGISTKGLSIYVSHFPCSVCAKLIANAGIKYCYFAEGSSNSDGERVLKSAKVKIVRVITRKK